MPLKLLSASAGSGKTYRLSREYARLCLEQRDPASAGSILAMTFTNKATQEMKKRILDLLLNLAERKESIAEKDVLFPLFSSLGYDELAKRAEAALQYLLKNYHFFSVSTIDKFFQGIIRQFQRELSLDFPMEVELDRDAVLNASIERLFERLDSQPEIRQWFSNWMRHKVADGGDWDVRKDLRVLGMELFNEGVSNQWEDSVSLEELSQVQTSLRKFCREVDQRFEENQKAVRELIGRADLSFDDFRGKENGSFISIWLRKTLIELPKSPTFMKAGDTDNWFNKSQTSEIKARGKKVEPELMGLLNQVYTWIEKDLPTYRAYQAVLKHFSTYVALRFLYDALKQYCIDSDKLLLSEANKMVAKVVSQNDLSLLYEKSGQRYHNLLIDEFQDTSESQWINLRPLFEQTLADGNYDLIVGDIKQAIYRWRSGNWEIMHRRVREELALGDELSVESLDFNYRSSPVIVDFNNQFFQRAVSWLISNYQDKVKPEAAAMLSELSSIYRDVIQQSADKNSDVSGLVKISLLDTEGLSTESELSEGDDALNGNDLALYQWFSSKVREVFQRGFSPKDIGVLVRTSKESTQVLQWLERMRRSDPSMNDVQAASDKGLRLVGNAVVELLVHLLSSRVMPRDKSRLPQIQYFYQLLKSDGTEEGFTFYQNELSPTLQKALVHPMATLSQWFAQVLEILDICDKSPLYAARFLDYVRDFELKFGADPNAFLQDWESNKLKLGVVIEGSDQAIQVMTIHKSKGLQFPVVILPFTNSEVIKFKNDSLIYVKHPTDVNLMQLGVFPVAFNRSKLEGTCFELDLHREMVMQIIDALNLLYVAYTRAEQQLEVAILQPSKKSETLRMADIIRHCSGFSTDQTQKVVTYGDPLLRKLKKKEESQQMMSTMVERLTFRSKTIKAGTWTDKELPGFESAVNKFGGPKMGTLVHEVLARMSSIDDLQRVFSQMEGEGLLIEELQREALKQKLQPFLALPEVVSWFAPTKKIYAEREIIEVDGKSYRPDRVVFSATGAEVIDFKTGKPSSNYERQIAHYAQLLQKMGVDRVSASIAYIDTPSIQKIKIENEI